MKLEFCSGGIIYKNEGNNLKFALILDSYDKWTFPKGHIEKGEKPEISAQREIKEEIGLKDLKVITIIDKIDYWFKLNGETFHKYVYFYLMEAPRTAQLKPQISEIKDAQWFSPQKTRELLNYKKDSLPLLQKAFKELKIRL